jgi:hypothetical protein
MMNTSSNPKNKMMMLLTVLILSVFITTLVTLFLQSESVQVAQAARKPGYKDEAEFNTWASYQGWREMVVPFVTNDTTWGWETLAIIQNTETDTSTIVLKYYDTTGAVVDVVNDELPPLSGRKYETPETFQGSILVTGTLDLVVLGNDQVIDPMWKGDGLMSYLGDRIRTYGKEFDLLPIYKAYDGWDSVFAVQNLSTVSAAITITIRDLAGTAIYTQTDELPAYSAHLYEPSAMEGIEAGFNGRAVVNSTQAIMGVVKNVNQVTGEAVAHNNHWRMGETPVFAENKLYLPLVLKDHGSRILMYSQKNDYASDIIVYAQQAGNSGVTINLYDQNGTFVSSYGPFELAGYEIRSVSLADTGWSAGIPDGFLGSAMIEFDINDDPVSALVETDWSPNPLTKSGYSGVWFERYDEFYVPYVSKSFDGTVTRIGVQNATFTQGNESQVTVSYYDRQGTLVLKDEATIKEYATYFFDQGMSNLPANFDGTAVVTGTEDLVVIGFISHRRNPEESTIDPLLGGTLSYTDTEGLTTQISVPSQAVSEAIVLAYTPLVSPTMAYSQAWKFAGRAFRLDVYIFTSGELLDDYSFQKPVTLTVEYSDTLLEGLDEYELFLEYWNGMSWEDAACGDYDRHPEENWLAVPVCHLSEFSLFGPRERAMDYMLYLPLVARDKLP